MNVLVRTFSQQLSSVEDLTGACQLLTDVVQRSTGYDRVMVYMFHPDHHGEVIAETLSTKSMPTSYKGIHFPEYDIPEQARACFIRNAYTHTPHVKHHEVPLVPTECSIHKERPDMTLVSLRAPATGCTQYYLNLGVMSSIVVSILSNGRLWGLLVAHALVPHFISFDQRIAIVMTVEVLSLFIKMREGERSKEAHETARPARQRILQMLEEGCDLQVAIASPQSNILDVIECHGACVVIGNKVHRFATTPSAPQIQRMLEWVCKERDGVLSTANLSEDWSGTHGFVEPAIGCLVQSSAARPTGERVSLVWFRMPSYEQAVWGGDPASSFCATGMVARADFKPFVQHTTISPKAWSDAECSVARELMEDLGLQLAMSQRGQRELDMKDRLLENIPNEMQAPLYVVNGLAEICLEAPHLPDDLRGHVEIIHQSGTSMQGMLNNVQTLGSVGQPVQGQTQDVQLVQLARSCMRTFAARLTAKGVQGRLVFDYDLEQMTLSVDKAQVQQLLINLIANALRYTTEGMITVKLTYDQSRRDLTVSVTDTGLSIAQEALPKVFDKLVDVGPSAPAQHSREGHLGLYIMKQVVVMMGGKVVSSQEDKGCTFWFTFPASGTPSEDGPSQFSLTASPELCTETVVAARAEPRSPLLTSPTGEWDEAELLPTSRSRKSEGSASLCSSIANVVRESL